ncbi:MAG: O-antigen ligase family protein [Syntrophomonadaceae bacterium]|jgi:tetratricopeptide (TPR) repeat protein
MAKKEISGRKKRGTLYGGDSINWQPTPKWLSLILFIVIALLIFYPPYVRGLCFNQDMFVYHILSALVFILFWIVKIKQRDYSFLHSYLDWAVLAYAAAYLLSLLGAVHSGEAIYGFLRALNLFMVYWMVSNLVKDYHDYENILRIIIASAAGVAVIGLLAATGYSNYPGAVIGSQIASTLQYSNAAAVLMAVVTLLGATLWIKTNKLLGRLIYGIICYMLLLVLLGTMSKGAWLIFAVGSLLLIWGLSGFYRIKLFYCMSLALVAALITSSFFIPLFRGEEVARALPFTLIGILIITGGEIIREGLQRLIHSKGISVKAVFISFILLVAILLVTLATKFPQILPADISAEILALTNRQSSSFITRMDMNNWAINIIKDHPVIGTGAGGWNALYHQYQDYLIYATEVHNHFLQVAVEAGIIGFLAFLAMWLLLLHGVFMLYRNYRRRRTEAVIDQLDYTANWILIWGTVSSALAFALHAAIDFDLSLTALALILWVLLALINAATRIEKVPVCTPQIKLVLNFSLATVMAFVLLIMGSGYTLAYNNAVAAGKQLNRLSETSDASKQNDLLAQAEKYYLRATSFDSHNAAYHANLAQVYALRFNQLRETSPPSAGEYYKKSQQEISQAEKYAPYDIKVRNSLINTCTRLGDIEQGIAQSEAVIAITPNDGNAYNVLIKILWAGCDSYTKAGQESKAGELARKVLEVEKRLHTQIKKINPDKTMFWNGPALQLDPESQLCIARVNYLLSNFELTRQILEPLIADPNAIVWYTAALYKMGRSAEAEQYELWLQTNSPQHYQQYQELLAQPLLK